MNTWPREEDDFMEIGETGLVPTSDGWFLNKHTGERMDPEGRIFSEDGEVVFDPFDEEDSWFDEDEYEWYED